MTTNKFQLGERCNVLEDGYFVFDKPQEIADIVNNGDGTSYYLFLNSTQSYPEIFIVPGTTPAEQAKFLGVNQGDLLRVYQKKRRIDQIKSRWTAAELYDFAFPPPSYIIPNFLTTGLNILAGRPKTGKSWLALQLCRAVGNGLEFFGEVVKPRRVLYLALEDRAPRLQSRLRTQEWTRQDLDNITFETRLPKKLDQGGIAWLQSEIATYGYSFVVIDTISRALSSGVRQSKVEDTTKYYEELQGIALDEEICIALVDHFSKAKDVEDVIDAVLGSTGKVGVSDTILGIFKKRHQHLADLKITGRDIEEKDLAVKFDTDTCEWILLGNREDVIFSKAQLKVIKAINDLGDKATFNAIEKETDLSRGYLSKILNTLDSDGKVEKPASRGGIYIISPWGTDNDDNIQTIITNNN